MARVTSYGAAEAVTGSCHLVEIEGVRLLIDCGMVQGGDEAINYEPFAFDVKSVDYLILTHAHIDHIGRVPKLVKEGFNGTIIATKPTLEIAQIMLLDAAVILGEEQKTLLKKAQRRGLADTVPEPLYTKAHVYQVFSKRQHALEYEESVTLAPFLSVSLHNAGHIMGSAYVQLDYQEDGISKRVIFSGDLGSRKRLVIDALSPAKKADVLFIESTYGDRNHRPFDESMAEFKSVLNETLKQNGVVLIPSFALERTQEILWVLKQMYDHGELERCEVFLDSPLAIEATRIYQKYPLNLSASVEETLAVGDDPFDFEWLSMTRRREDSTKINEVDKRAIIIAGSGMCTGGRILHHLKNRVWNKNNAVIFVGFQVGGTLGRKMIDGAETISIYGEDILVKASIHTIGGFSAHGDASELMAWIKGFEKLSFVFLIHGEREKMEVFQTRIKEETSLHPHIVKKGETIFI